MAQDTVLVEDKGAVRILTFNRPKTLNALNKEMGMRLIEELNAAQFQKSVGAVILTGAGRAFSAGADLKGFARIYDENDHNYRQEFLSLELPRIFANFGKPLLAAVNGPAVGWGFTVSLMCDLRLMSQEAFFMAGFVRVGVTPEFGSSHLLPAMVGLGRAQDMVLTAREVHAQEAQQIGLVSEICLPSGLLRRAVELAKLMASYPRPAMSMAKALLRHGAGASLEQTMEYERMCFMTAMQSPEHRQAVEQMLKSLAAS